MHMDLMVEDLDVAETAVMELGASKAEHQPGETFRVFLDPAGHPSASARSKERSAGRPAQLLAAARPMSLPLHHGAAGTP